MKMDVVQLYRAVCAMGGGAATLSPCWSSAFQRMANWRNGEGKPTSCGNAVHTFYVDHLLSYEREHPADVTAPVCPLCGSSSSSAASTPAKQQPRWKHVWRECGGCKAWVHKACADRAETVLRGGTAFCKSCFPRDEARHAAAPAEACSSGEEECAPQHRVCFLPPHVNTTRAFAAVAGRCSLPLGVCDFDRFRALLAGAQRVLERGLSRELVARSLGLVPDEVEPHHKTVALLTDGDSDTVLSAMVVCGDAHRNGAQVLVAATDPSARRGGCMRALLSATASFLAADGIGVMCLATARTDSRAAAVWRRLGFRPAPCWPANFVSRQTSADLGPIFTRPTGLDDFFRTPTPSPPRVARLAVGGEGEARQLPSGVPPEWPAEVPFTSGCVAADLHPACWPQLQQPRVVVRRIPRDAQHPCAGGFGLFARVGIALQRDECLLAYGGVLRARAHSDSLFLASAGGGLDVDAASCGNEARYLNHFAGIAQAPNAELCTQTVPLSGARWVAVRLLQPVAAGEELLLDYGEEYSPSLLRRGKRKRGDSPPAFVPRRPRDSRRIPRTSLWRLGEDNGL